MKQKVKKYAGGTAVTSRGGDTNMRTRSDEEFAEDSKFGGYGRYMPKGGSLTRGIKETSRPSEDLAPYEPESPFLNRGTGTDITNKPESVKPIIDASRAPAADDSDTYAPKTRTFSTTGPAKKKVKPKPRYSGVVSSEDLGSQDFSSKAKPKPTGDSGLSKAALAAGLGLAGAAGAGLLAGRRRMQSGTRGERVEPTMGSTRSPVRSMTAEEAAFENEGGRAFKKGGKTKKMASGGKVSSASSRGDGIAQRGKTKGRMC
jgi:hypothetical protein